MRGNTGLSTGAASAARDAVTSFAGCQTTRCAHTTQAAGRRPDHGFPAKNPPNAGTERWLVEPVISPITRGRVARVGELSAW